MATQQELERAFQAAVETQDYRTANEIAEILESAGAAPDSGRGLLGSLHEQQSRAFTPPATETPAEALMHGGGKGLADLGDAMWQGAQRLNAGLAIMPAMAADIAGIPREENVAGQAAAGTMALPTQPLLGAGTDRGLRTAPADPANQPFFTFGEYTAPAAVLSPFTAKGLAGVGNELMAASFGGAGAAIGEQAGKDFEMGPVGRVAGGILGNLTPAGLSATTRGLARGGAAGRQNVSKALDDFGRLGVTPTAAEAAGTGRMALVQRIASVLPGGNVLASYRAKKLVNKIGRYVDDVSESLTRDADPARAGMTVERGITGSTGFVSRFQDTAHRLYKRVDDLVAPTTVVPARNTRRVLDDLAGQTEEVQEVLNALRSDRLGRVYETFMGVSEGGVTYQGLRAVRSEIGRKLTSAALVDDLNKGQLKQIYAALSQDTLEAASAAGPDAVKAANRANAFYRSGMSRIEDVLEPLLRNKTPERIYRALETGGKSGPTQLRAIKKSLKPDEWDAVVAVAMKRMGRANPSVQNEAGDLFSSQTFLTNWNKLDPSAKRAMFSGPARRDMDTIARAAEAIREVEMTMPNFSGTAQLAINVASAAGGYAYGFMPEFLKVVVGSTAATALFQSPRFVRWLAKSTTIPVSQLPTHVLELKKVAAESPAATDAIEELINSLRGTQQEAG